MEGTSETTKSDTTGNETFSAMAMVNTPVEIRTSFRDSIDAIVGLPVNLRELSCFYFFSIFFFFYFASSSERALLCSKWWDGIFIEEREERCTWWNMGRWMKKRENEMEGVDGFGCLCWRHFNDEFVDQSCCCCCCKCGTGGDDELADCHVSFCTCGSLTVGLLDTSLHLIVSYVCSDSSWCVLRPIVSYVLFCSWIFGLNTTFTILWGGAYFCWLFV